jgi:hypothetical protein
MTEQAAENDSRPVRGSGRALLVRVTLGWGTSVRQACWKALVASAGAGTRAVKGQQVELCELLLRMMKFVSGQATFSGSTCCPRRRPSFGPQPGRGAGTAV